MTDKLICPFCGELMEYDARHEIYGCENCVYWNFYGSKDLWRKAAVLQKKLDKAILGIWRMINSDLGGLTEELGLETLAEIEDIKE